MDKINKTEEDWKKNLSEEEYNVLRKGGTEQAFSGEYLDADSDGMYHCKGCGAEIFSSDTKFKSGTGWPSFYAPIDEGRVELREDRSHGMVSTEVLCARCGGHLGHVFNDGPKPTGKRFCINSCALDLEEK